jgi:phosphohistidine phosphatase
MLVGHLPFMARLASRLLAGRDDRMSVAFPAGAVACLGYDPDDGWSLEWMVTPDML